MGASPLEKIRMSQWIRSLCCLVLAMSLASCSSKFLKAPSAEALKPNDEFEKSVTIVVPGTEGSTVATAPKPPEPAPPIVPAEKGKKKKHRKKGKATVTEATPAPLPPDDSDIENREGFQGRRPIVDPFRVGESVVLNVHYFKFSAGTLTLKVDPFAEVNGHKAYNFVTQVQTSPTFSSLVHAVDDSAVTLLDYDLMVPRVFTLHVKETQQLREARSIFDFDSLKARYWEKKVTEKSGVEEKRQEWTILPWSQNVFSAVFYMRTFKWDIGKEYAFRVADDEQNIVFKAKALRREVLETDLGPKNAIVIKPEIMVQGIFKPVGDIYFWLSDDDRKLVLRIESKIKIGTLVAEIRSLTPGQEP